MRKYTVAALLLGLTLGVLAALPASAQQVLILGSDTGTFADGGITRRVKVDAQGRLVIGQIGGATTDGGTAITVPYCVETQNRTTSISGTPTNLAVLPGRWMTRICNSPRNSGTPIITCSSDGVSPDAGILGVGESLEVGDCAVWTTGAAVTCISDTASTSVTSWDCR